MRFRSPISPDEVEALVRARLDVEAGSIDVPHTLSRLQNRLAREGTTEALPLENTTRTNKLGQFGNLWKMALAASVLLIVGSAGYFLLNPGEANAYSLLREAHSTLAKNADRCYVVAVDAPRRWARRIPLLQGDGEMTLWTRGDRFHMTSRASGRTIHWGQDASRRLWLVADPQHGLQFAPGEAPESLARPQRFLAVDLRHLAHRFLEDFDLQIEQIRREGRTRLITVRANLKKGHPPQPFDEAVITLDAKTKTIHNLELVRHGQGQLTGRFSFTLVEQKPQADDYYELGTYLEPGAVLLGPRESAERTKLLDELLETDDRL